MLSAHADAGEILGWLDGFAAPPREAFVVHGEAAAAGALVAVIAARPGWTARVPTMGETVELGA
jgi:metallo-beta-lactamase family protein